MPPELARPRQRPLQSAVLRLDHRPGLDHAPSAPVERATTMDVLAICPPATLTSIADRVTRIVRRRRRRRDTGVGSWIEQMVGEDTSKRLDLARNIATLRHNDPRRKRETLSGSTDSFPVPELFGLMRARASNGVLGLGLNDERVAFHLRRGRLARGLSDRPPQGTKLGEILMEWKLLDPRALKAILEKRPNEDVWLGRALVEHGLASKEEVRCALAEQARRLMRRSQAIAAAPFAFVECDVDEPADGLTFDLDALLIDSARSLDEEAHVSGLRTRLREYEPRALGARRRR